MRVVLLTLFVSFLGVGEEYFSPYVKILVGVRAECTVSPPHFAPGRVYCCVLLGGRERTDSFQQPMLIIP